MKNSNLILIDQKPTGNTIAGNLKRMILMCMLVAIPSFIHAQVTSEFNYSDAITIDGNLEDWAGINAIDIDTIGSGTIDNDTDLNAAFKAAWDDENIYMAFIITDTIKINKYAAKVWNRDGIEVAFNLKGNDIYNLTNLFDDNDEGKISVVYGDNRDSTISAPSRRTDQFLPNADFDLVTTDTDTGYVIEFKIPFNNIYTDFEARNGERFNMGIRVIDSDGASDSTAIDGRLCWGGVININKDASDFPFVTLNGRTELPEDLTINYNSDITIDGDFSDWSEIIAQPINIYKSGIINDEKDFSANMKMAWDTAKLYMLINVFDDSLSNNDAVAVHRRDAIEIGFNLANNDIYNVTNNFDDNDEGKILIVYEDTRDSIISASGRLKDQFIPSDDFDLKIAENDTGYTYEIAIPFKDIYMDFVANNDTIFEMGIVISDNDGEDRDAQISYGGKNNINKDRADFVNITLSGKIISNVKNEITNSLISVYPNPVLNRQLNIKVKENLNSDLYIVVTNIMGQEVISKVITANQSSELVKVVLPENVNAGLYIVTFSSNETEASQTILVK